MLLIKKKKIPVWFTFFYDLLNHVLFLQLISPFETILYFCKTVIFFVIKAGNLFFINFSNIIENAKRKGGSKILNIFFYPFLY